jgi:uncharacterized protein YgiM (DUF1202 family)
MPKVIKVLPLVVFVIVLTGCALPSAQPYAALYQPPNPQPTLQPTQILQPAQEATGSPTTRAACEVSALYALNLRSAPGTSYGVIGVLSAGDVLTMTGNQRGAWWEVVTADGVTGWVNSNYCNNNKGK